MPRLAVPAVALLVGTIMFQTTAAYAAKPVSSAQVSRLAGVTMTVVPPEFSSVAAAWNFTITLESHVQSLDDDLITSATLIGDGKAYRPEGWIGDPPGGHHRKGVLRFKSVTPLPRTIELQVHRAGEAGPRIFRWEVK